VAKKYYTNYGGREVELTPKEFAMTEKAFKVYVTHKPAKANRFNNFKDDFNIGRKSYESGERESYTKYARDFYVDWKDRRPKEKTNGLKKQKIKDSLVGSSDFETQDEKDMLAAWSEKQKAKGKDTVATRWADKRLKRG
tara:strand:- start:3356 stop:3772 length:417 start_codon:yes stop_codon:yes gene_type:complete